MIDPAASRRIRIDGSYLEEEPFLAALLRKDADATRSLVRQIRVEAATKSDYSLGLILLSKAFRAKILGWLEYSWFKGDSETALEAWNDTLYRVWSRIGEYEETKSAFLTWVMNQARYAALDLQRKPYRRREIVFEGDEETEIRRQEKEESGGPGDLLARGLMAEAKRLVEEPSPLTRAEEKAIKKAMRRLTNSEQWLLRLRFVFGYGNVEIAREGLAGRPLPEEHVRVYVNRALKRLERFYLEELAELR